MDELIKYLKVFVVPEIGQKYKMHKDLPEYEPYWNKLNSQLQKAIDILSNSKVIAECEVTGTAFWSEGNGKTQALILHTTNGDVKVGDLYMDKALEYVGKKVKLILQIDK